MEKKRKKAVFNWSGGKDSALALWRAIESGDYEIVALLTTVNEAVQRSSMHGIPLALLRRQAESIGIPFFPVMLAPDGSMERYETGMRQAVEYFKNMGVTHFIFGDIFLEDIRAYRERQLAPYGIEVVEPLWGKSSGEVMEEFLASGLRTVIVTTMADRLDERFIGRVIDRAFIASLPQGIDPCGENGEYHTFCFDGGMFRHAVPFSLGESLRRSFPVRRDDGGEDTFEYCFADLRE